MKRTKIGSLMYSLTMAICGWLTKCRPAFWVLTFTWGIIGTLFGLIAYFFVSVIAKKQIRGVYYGYRYIQFGDNWGGLEGGPVFFVAMNMGHDWTEHTKHHEIGHSFQNAIYGPFALLLIMIPSAIRYWVFRYRTKHGKQNPEYDSAWFEQSATDLGDKYVAERDEAEDD